MAKAYVLLETQLERVVNCQMLYTGSRSSLRNVVMLLLSHRVGLRAQEIAYLRLRDVLDIEGRIGTILHVTKQAAKYGKERYVPMSDDLQRVLRVYVREVGIKSGPLFFTQYGTPMTPNAVSKELGRMYLRAGFPGASSHSGRRTFITRALRAAGTGGWSLIDVQQLAGHANPEQTIDYAEPSQEQRKLVNSIVAQRRKLN